MLKIVEIKKCWWNEDLVYIEFEYDNMPVTGVYNKRTGKMEEYSITGTDPDDFYIYNEVTGEYEYSPLPDIKIDIADEKEIIRACCSYIKNLV